jgi:hypothetical protein
MRMLDAEVKTHRHAELRSRWRLGNLANSRTTGSAGLPTGMEGRHRRRRRLGGKTKLETRNMGEFPQIMGGSVLCAPVVTFLLAMACWWDGASADFAWLFHCTKGLGRGRARDRQARCVACQCLESVELKLSRVVMAAVGRLPVWLDRLSFGKSVNCAAAVGLSDQSGASPHGQVGRPKSILCTYNSNIFV